MKKKKHQIRLWEWILSIGINIIAGTIIWTNNTVDLLVKFGWKTVNGGQAILFFMIIMAFSLSWFITIIMRKRGVFKNE